MLTGDLVRAQIDKKVIRPSFIDPSAPRLLTRAESIIAVMTDAVEEGWTRGRIQTELREVEGTDTDHKITKGLAKLLMDKGTFETCSPIDPSELRQAIFARAAVLGPLARQAGPTERRTADTVLTEFADQYDTTVEAIRRALYADLKDEQVLTACKLPTPEALLHRYNVALVQALLIRASRLQVDLVDATPKYVRQLLRNLKFHQLMYRSEYRKGTLSIELDGPQSLLRLSTRYGLQLANFFPAVLLQPGPWRMEAEILWGKKRKFRKSLSLDHEMNLVSHYQDTGTWTSRTESWFVDRFAQLESDWNLGPGEPIDLGDQTMIVPDFTFRKDGRVGHLEIVGFWRKKHLSSHLANLPANVIVAVSSKLAGEGGGLTAALEDQVIRFAEVIPPKKVVERLERISR